ncbi:PTS sugar transporter subunit IIA [Liquorilactobacillus mali]|uniref:Phosphotransferase system, mannose fructose-specific component IIA n=1 Tax=Liquorilactobacillus mali KCTC 3596 = DSM 20444 TaxID=1046596 RepID=A0A0R2EBU0_9LACO|nr:PTS sugar transporter subunit IIA [Liquorilactobacillus mali]KRN09517.1 phosphotransferase system, mannose fructose-specific component IIA [Liquorilactobacillus mali KCTC 3596 = DSM 20444]MDC7952490.1 PTS sugar transporter subunit IIA [Liquorilactobacillus mali]MDV7757379.1 PTS sugar transporter subunit IIA [Liquorilactobacillus mali]QFQ73654.1 PTS sugar transporter subunit IIA [Liquorilactobacillus mali]
MKLILASHGPLAKAILASAELIIGKIDDVATFSLTKEMGPKDLEKELSEEIEKTDDTDIILGLDLLGGTPSNVSVALLAKYPNLEVLTGINLPMIIEYGNQKMLGQLDVAHLISMGTSGINNVKEKLAEDQDDED